MRYAIALVVAILLIGVGVSFVRHTEHSVERLFRQALRDAEAAGQLPATIDPEQAQLTDFGIDLPASYAGRVRIAHVLVAQRFVLIPAVLSLCLGIARLLRRKQS